MTAWLRRHRTAITVFVVAVAWFAVGLGWGLPIESEEARRSAWGPDELGPMGSIGAIEMILRIGGWPSPQYPLGQYFAQAVFVWPYSLVVRGAEWAGTGSGDHSVVVLTFLHRLPSALMAAGLVTAAWTFVRRVTDSDFAAWSAAALTASCGPILYYARTSNVDMGALFWTVLALVVALGAIREGLTGRRAVLLGLLAAASIATKDQQYAFFVGLGVVILASHLRHPDRSTTPWKEPAIALVVSSVAYLLLSGAILRHEWFLGHVDFVLAGNRIEMSDELRARIGFYFSNPPTIGGYATVLGEAALQVGAAVGLPALVLAVIGLGAVAKGSGGPRAGWWAAGLLAGCLTLVLGVLIPVRFVLPRFVLPIDVVLCLFAGVGVAWIVDRSKRRGVGIGVVLAVVAWSGVRAVDFTLQMTGDSRYEAGAWMQANLQPGDTLGYYGAGLKLPAVPTAVTTVRAPGQYLPENFYGEEGPVTETPTLLVVVPQQLSEPQHEWSLPDSTFAALMAGSAGYRQVLALQKPSLFPRPLRVAPFVNPQVRLFARDDVADRFGESSRIELPDPGGSR